jgi:hypothetical protein
LRHFFETTQKRLGLDNLATKTAFDWIAAPAKACQLSARAETELTFMKIIPTASAPPIARLYKYAEFIDSSPAYVVTEALKLLFNKDGEFKSWLGQHANNHDQEKTEDAPLAKPQLR